MTFIWTKIHKSQGHNQNTHPEMVSWEQMFLDIIDPVKFYVADLKQKKKKKEVCK